MEDEPGGEGVNGMKGAAILLIALCIALGAVIGTELVYAVDKIELLQPAESQAVETGIGAGEAEAMRLIAITAEYDPYRIEALRPAESQEVETGIGAGEAEEMLLLPVGMEHDPYRINTLRPH